VCYLISWKKYQKKSTFLLQKSFNIIVAHKNVMIQEKRERVHHSIRRGSISEVMTLLADENDTGSGKLLAIGKNTYGRCSLHIAVLCQQEEIVDYLAITFPDTLRIGDNVSLHLK